MTSSNANSNWIDPSARPVAQIEHGMNEFLSKVLQECRTRANQMNSARKVVLFIVRELIDRMKQDPFFSKMFVSYKLRGSAENKLKVLKPNEFDVDVLMKMPIREERDDSVKVIHSDQYPSWAECRLESTSILDTSGIVPEKIRKFKKKAFDPSGRLRSDGLRNWIQGNVVKALRRLENEPQSEGAPWKRWSDLTVVCSGPAVTVSYVPSQKCSEKTEEIRLEDMAFSFDFVPAIIVPNYCKSGILKSLRESVGLQITINEKDLDDTYLVPVAPRVAISAPDPPNYLLRLSLPSLDEKVLEGRETLKDLIRIVKVLLVKNTWNPISSYAVVNLCVSLNLSTKKENLPSDFFLIISSLSQSLKVGKIPLVWSPDCNLIVKLNNKFRSNVSKRLDKFLKSYTDLKLLCENYEKRFLTKTSNSLNQRTNSKTKSPNLDIDKINKNLKKNVGNVTRQQKVFLENLFFPIKELKIENI